MALELLFPHFDELIRTPEDVQRLNEAILQLAVQGKLVPQDPEDEPASELLKHIEQPKAWLPPIEAETAPFAASSGWTWLRLGNLAEVVSGVTLGRNLVNYETVSLPYLRVANVQRGYLDLAEIKMVDVKIDEKDKYLLRDGDLLLTEGGDSDKLGRAAIWRAQISVCIHQNHIFRARPLGAASAEWLMLCTNSPYGRDYFLSSSKKSTNLASINSTQLKNCPIALPPIAEQQRILAKVDQLFAQTRALEASLRQAQADIVTANRAALHRLHTAQDNDQFQAAWRTLREHFDVLYDDPRNVAELRQAILDLAVRGKLVAQDSADEPAGELLKRIEAEKRRLAGGHKVLRRIQAVDLEIGPYPLPPAWVWVRVGDAGIINARNNVDADTLVSFIPMALINDGIGSGHSAQVALWRDVRNGFTHFAENDVGIAKITPCFQNRKSTVFRDLTNGVGAGTTELHVFRSFGGCVLPDYALLFFQSPEFIEKGKASMTGTAGQQRVPRSYVEEALFPLPPVVEQHRIVTKVDQLMRLCDALEAGLAQGEALRHSLAAAVWHQTTAS